MQQPRRPVSYRPRMSTADPVANLSLLCGIVALLAVAGMLVYAYLLPPETQPWNAWLTLALYSLVATVFIAPLFGLSFGISALGRINSAYRPRTVRLRATVGLALSLIAITACAALTFLGMSRMD